MTTDIKTYNFNGYDVRIIVGNDGEPWFVAKDVAEILVFRDAYNMLRHVEVEDKDTQIVSTPGGKQRMYVINESGLYAAILYSRRPEAKEFKRWVTSEILPSIRKHGMYATDNKIEEMLEDPDTMIRTLEKLKEEKKKRQKAERFAEDRRKQIEEDLSVQASVPTFM